MTKAKLQLPRSAWYALAGLLFVLTVVFWATDLDVDPPMYFSGFGQSLSTDPAQYVYHARNAILFDDWDPFDYARWTVYQHSLTSLVGYIWLSITEPSLANGNAVGLILSLGGLLLLALVFWRRHSPWTVAALVLMFGMNGVLTVYGRLSYLENGVIFLGALTFLIFIFWGKQSWGIALAGAAAAAAMLLGKLFGALFLPILLLAIWSEATEDRWRRIIFAVGGFVAATAALVLVLYPGNWSAAFGYVAEQSYGLRGFPDALTSPLLFIEKLVTYGVVNRIYERSPDLLFMMVVSSVLLAFYWGRGGRLRDLPRTAIYSFWWIIICWVGLMALNYSPLRYSLTYLPAIIILSLSLLDWLINKGESMERPVKPIAFIPVLLVLWVVAANFIGHLFLRHVQPAPIGQMTWFGLIVAAALTTAWFLFNQKTSYRIERTAGIVAAAVIIALSIGVQTVFQSGISEVRNYNIKEASQDIGRILGDDAVISGPYGAMLGMENDLKTFIHLFGVASVDTALFERYPVTHIAAEQNNWQLAMRDYPVLKDVGPIASYWIRDIEVGIYPIYDRFDNPEANAYQPSLYEQAVVMYQQELTDSAFVLIERFEAKEPLTKTAGPLYLNKLYDEDRGREVVTYLRRLAGRYPTDFGIQVRCGQLLQILGMTNMRQDFIFEAQSLYNQAALVNPNRSNMIAGTFQATMQQFSQPPQPQSPPPTP